MRTISINTNELDSGTGTVSSTPLSDAFTEFLQVPVTKLDADHYSAEDLDGVTESLFGSGNLNFMMLQAGQTDGAMALNHAGASHTDAETVPGAPGDDLSGRATASAGTDTLTGRAGADSGGEAESGNFIASGNFANGTIGAIGAGSLAAKSGGSGALLDSRSFASTGSNGTDGGGSDGGQGRDGSDGDPAGDIATNHFNDTNLIDLTEVTNFVDNVFNEVTNLTEIFEGDNLTDVVTNTVNSTASTLQTNITNILNQLPILGGDGGINPPDNDISLNGILPEGELDVILDPVEDLAGDLDIGVSLNSLLGDGETSNALGDTDLMLGGNLQLAGAPLGLPQLHIGLDPVESLLGDIDLDLTTSGNLLGAVAPGLIDDAAGGTGLDSVQSVLADALTPIATGLLGTGDDGGGTDGDVQLGTDIGLGDLVENLGLEGTDLDDLNLGNDLAGGVQSVALDPIEDLIGDIDLAADIGLMGGGETDNSAGDSDLSVPLDLGLADNGLSDIAIDIPLDPVEEIAGDIDIDLGLAVNLLGDTADGLVNDGAGGTGDSTIISNLGDDLGALGDDVIEDIHADLADTLPDASLDDLLGGADNDIAGDLGDALGALEDSIIDDVAADLADALPDTGLDDLLGEMDNDIIAAIDLLPGGENAGENGEDSGGMLADDVIGWTEAVIPDAGDLLGGLADSGDAGSILPDPVGQIAEGLGGLLDGGSSGGGGLGGGLLGNQGGGLFG